jgi:hypothetical protein
MKRIVEVVYGLGGYDETKPNNNIVEIIEELEQTNQTIVE